MIIELQRKLIPEDALPEENCGICGEVFGPESVLAVAVSDSRYEKGNLCSECIEYFGRRAPGRFPTIEEYEEAKRRHPEPEWASAEELRRVEALLDGDGRDVWTRERRLECTS